MRHLVDLNSKVAIITWWEKNSFPGNTEREYEDLYRKKFQYKDKLTNDEENRMIELSLLKCEVVVRIESIQIVDMAARDRDVITPTSSLTGGEWNIINNAISKLKEQIKSIPVTLNENLDLKEW